MGEWSGSEAILDKLGKLRAVWRLPVGLDRFDAFFIYDISSWF